MTGIIKVSAVNRLRRDFIFYPENLYTGIAAAIIYCFIFWKLRNLGRYRIPLFFYAAIIQLAFLGLFAWTSMRFREDESFSRDYVDTFGNGIILFYFLMLVPLLVGLWIHTYRGIGKLEVGKAAHIIMMGMFVAFCLMVSVIGFYLHLFFYYGFAP